jgi:dienelactone hydrolase
MARHSETTSELSPKSLTLQGREGRVQALLYEAPGAQAATLLGGGVGGGFDSPAHGLYPRLGEALLERDLSTLRIRYHNPTDLSGAVADVLTGLRFLEEQGVERVGLVGHSFGGAVMIAAAARSSRVRTVVALAPQSYGTESMDRLGSRPLLLIHGMGDTVLPPSCSRSIRARAQGPVHLELLPETGHMLDEAAEYVFHQVQGWLLRELQPLH